MPNRKYWPALYAIGGALVAFVDWAFFWSAGIEIKVGDTSVTTAVMVFFGLTYAVFGGVIGALMAARHKIAEQLEALESAKAREVELENLASIGRLAAGVAHEVRNPLAVIRSSAGLLLETATDPDAETAGRFIHEEVDRLDAFIGALLDFSRPVSASRTSTSTAQLSERAARLTDARVEWALGDSAIDADADQVVQLLNTLVMNAQAAAERVSVRAVETPETLRFEVRDDGPGVAPEHQPDIFQPFFTTKAQGTGLGLPMARRIAQAHGGQLDYISGAGLGEGGAGACFRVSLPR